MVKVLPAVRGIFLHGNNRNYNSCKFSYKFTLIPFLSFLKYQKQESNFQQGGGLLTRTIFVFCLLRVALYFKALPNSINFYKEPFKNVVTGVEGEGVPKSSDKKWDRGGGGACK